MTRVIYAALARADILDIWLNVAEKNGLALADEIVDRIERRAAMLAKHPLMGLARPEIGEGARSLLIERWLILYSAENADVRVMRVVDGARDLARVDLKRES